MRLRVCLCVFKSPRRIWGEAGRRETGVGTSWEKGFYGVKGLGRPGQSWGKPRGGGEWADAAWERQRADPRWTAQGGGPSPWWRCAQPNCPPHIPQVPPAIPSPPACWVLTAAPSQTTPGTLTRTSPAPSPSCPRLCTPRTSTPTLWPVLWATCPQQGQGEALQLHPYWQQPGRAWAPSAPRAWQQPLAWHCRELGVQRLCSAGRTTVTRSWRSQTSVAAALTARATRASLCLPRPRRAKGGSAAEPVWGEGFCQGEDGGSHSCSSLCHGRVCPRCPARGQGPALDPFQDQAPGCPPSLTPGWGSHLPPLEGEGM